MVDTNPEELKIDQIYLNWVRGMNKLSWVQLVCYGCDM